MATTLTRRDLDTFILVGFDFAFLNALNDSLVQRAIAFEGAIGIAPNTSNQSETSDSQHQ